VRRRGSRWFGRASRGGGRLLERLRELKGLELKDLRAVERLSGTPEEIELGVAKRGDARSVGVIVSRRDGLDLVGWAQLLAAVPEALPDCAEVVLVAPLFGSRTRRAAERAATSGPALRLVTYPGLADPSAELLDQEVFPAARAILGSGSDASTVFERVLRVIDGAAAISSCGALRRVTSGYVLYVRGASVLQVVPEGDSVEVTFSAPERRRVHVGEQNFSRWGGELHETILQLARDPRLLDERAENRQRASERVAADAGCRITGYSIPWNADGSDPADWVGIDNAGRPVLGVVRSSITLGDAAGWIAALQVLEEERERWVPGARGATRLLIASERDDPRVRSALSRCGLEVALHIVGPEEEEEEKSERERRGRRRSRRRRRERGEGWSRGEPRAREASEAVEESESAEPEEASEIAAEAREEAGFEESAVSAAETAPVQEADEEALPESEELEHEAPDWERPSLLEASSGAAEVKAEAEEEEEEQVSGSEALDIEVEATLAQEPEEEEAIEAVLPRRRNPRAAIVVRNDHDCILAALILARDRRNIVSFRVCRQEGLMDYFRGPATDLPENCDLLLVGLTAHPVSQEVISAAGLFRGRAQWFDHHEWPIEDVERLRDAIGRDAIAFEPGASSPLAAIVQVTERRSRFTDKLVELAARRLSENDMTKWGYRMVGLLKQLVATESEYRNEIQPVLAGKPSELPEVESVYHEEEAWISEHDPRIVHFGEHQMAVLRVPSHLDAGEVGRRTRLRTGARLSLTSREGDDLVLLSCNDEKRHINISGIIGCVTKRVPWAESTAGGDRTGRLRIEHLNEHPERIEAVIGEIVKHRSILYG